MRVSPAITLGDSIRQTASIVRCISVAATATDHTIYDLFSASQTTLRPAGSVLLLTSANRFADFVHLTNLCLAFPSRPVFFVQFHKAHSRSNCLFLRRQLELRIAADNLLCLSKRTIINGHLAIGKPHASARTRRLQAATSKHGSGFRGLFPELSYGLHQFFRRR